MEEKSKQLYLRMGEALHKEIRHEAAEYDTSLNTCVLTLLREVLAARHASFPNPQHNAPKR
jgi:predicted HicB family RNase H-like nuclease